MIIVIAGNHAEIMIEILVVEWSPASPGAGMRRSRRRSGVPSCNDLK